MQFSLARSQVRLLLVIFGLAVLSIVALGVKTKQELRKGATGEGELRIEIAFPNCFPWEGIEKGKRCNFSALVFDSQNRPLFNGFEYIWSISSDGSLGKFSHLRGPVTSFTAEEEGKGVITVIARSVGGVGSSVVSKSFKLLVGDNGHTLCQPQNGVIKVYPRSKRGVCNNLQEAIQAAGNGDLIELQPGSYETRGLSNYLVDNHSAAFLIENKNIRIRAAGFSEASTDSKKISPEVEIVASLESKPDYLFIFRNSRVELAGVRILGGKEGAVYLMNSGGVISGNWFDSDQKSNGSLIFLSDANDLVVENNRFLVNGRGVFVKNSKKVKLFDNYFPECRLLGTVIDINDSSNMQIERNLFDKCSRPVSVQNSENIFVMDNKIKGVVTGAGISTYQSRRVKISHNRILRGKRDGISATKVKDIIIDYNLIANLVSGSSYPTVGIALSGGGGVVLHNTVAEVDIGLELSSATNYFESLSIGDNVFSARKFGVEGDGILQFLRGNFKYNDVWCGGSPSCYRASRDWTGEYGNLSVDPLLGEDYCLKASSPLIRAGERGGRIGAIDVCNSASESVATCRRQEGKMGRCLNTGDISGFSCWFDGDCDKPKRPVGDANGDGRVDLNDYSVWLNHTCIPGEGQFCLDLRGDFDGDGNVDKKDINIWSQTYKREIEGVDN
jgi:hypothetical protein